MAQEKEYSKVFGDVYFKVRDVNSVSHCVIRSFGTGYYQYHLRTRCRSDCKIIL